MELEYTLNDAGWAKAVLIDDGGSYEMTVSYLKINGVRDIDFALESTALTPLISEWSSKDRGI